MTRGESNFRRSCLRGGKPKWFLGSIALINIAVQIYFYEGRTTTDTTTVPVASLSWRSMLQRYPELIPVEKKLQSAGEYIMEHGTDDMRTAAVPLLLFAYQRGGSSFAGQLMTSHPASFYWFEALKGPIRDLYGEPQNGVITLPIQYSVWRNGSIRHPPQYEVDALTEEIAHVMKCELSQLNMKTQGRHGYIHASMSLARYYGCYARKSEGIKLEMTCEELESELCPNLSSHYTTYEAYACRQKMRKALENNSTDLGFNPERLNRLRMCHEKLKNIIKTCLPEVQYQCDRSIIRVAKVIRTSMETTAELLIKYPSMLVVHLIRDPRGILRSRLNLKYMRSEKLSEEARDLCTAMLHDIRIRRRLEKMFKNNLLELRYEDMAEDPVTAAMKIYELAGIDLAESAKEKLVEMVRGGRDDGSPFGLVRANGSATANAWKGMSPYQLQTIDLQCQQLYDEAGYVDSFKLGENKSFIRRESPLE